MDHGLLVSEFYGIDAQTGNLRWVNHANGLWGKLLRCLDFVPGFTNEFRDVPKCVVDQYVVTARGRILDVRTGQDCPFAKIKKPNSDGRTEPQHKLYANKSLKTDGNTIKIEGPRNDFVIHCRDRNGNNIWRFSARESSSHVADGCSIPTDFTTVASSSFLATHQTTFPSTKPNRST
jgi:hypothetical protein